MLSQTVLSFKLDSTDETLTAHSGLVLFGEYCQGMGLAQWLDQALPPHGSGAGYAPSMHAQALLLTLHGGGRSLEDVRTLRSDTGLLVLLQISTLPSSDALGDWLRRMGSNVGMAGFAAIAVIPGHDWTPWRDGEIAETVHSMNRTRKAFRLIVMRRGAQGELFDTTAPWHYSVIASNRQDSTADTLAWYRQRGDASENRIKELKLGFSMERMPCGQFEANAAFFQIGVLAYNLFKGFTREAMADTWCQRQVQTLRWRTSKPSANAAGHYPWRACPDDSSSPAQRRALQASAWPTVACGMKNRFISPVCRARPTQNTL